MHHDEVAGTSTWKTEKGKANPKELVKKNSILANSVDRKAYMSFDLITPPYKGASIVGADMSEDNLKDFINKKIITQVNLL